MSYAATRSFVYFARCGEYVKIGFSHDPEQRLKCLQSSVHRGSGIVPDDIDRNRPLELIHLIPGCRMRDERIIHGLFHMHAAAGEWFRYDLAFQRHLAALDYITCHERQLAIRDARAAARLALRRHQNEVAA
jgi:hypothetical protein